MSVGAVSSLLLSPPWLIGENPWRSAPALQGCEGPSPFDCGHARHEYTRPAPIPSQCIKTPTSGRSLAFGVVKRVSPSNLPRDDRDVRWRGVSHFQELEPHFLQRAVHVEVHVLWHVRLRLHFVRAEGACTGKIESTYVKTAHDVCTRDTHKHITLT